MKATMMSGYDPSYNSGYTGIVYDDGLYTPNTEGIYSYPNAKYYDKYSFGTSDKQRIRSKLGDSIKEVLNTSSEGWYSDSSYLADSLNPWFKRGGFYGYRSNANMFDSISDYGDANGSSSRLVITP